MAEHLPAEAAAAACAYAREHDVDGEVLVSLSEEEVQQVRLMVEGDTQYLQGQVVRVPCLCMKVTQVTGAASLTNPNYAT